MESLLFCCSCGHCPLAFIVVQVEIKVPSASGAVGDRLGANEVFRLAAGRHKGDAVGVDGFVINGWDFRNRVAIGIHRAASIPRIRLTMASCE